MIYKLGKEIVFPPLEMAEPDGLLAIGGDLSTQRLLAAYRLGIFPWYESGEPLWWSPDPRMVLFPEEFRINKTVKKLIKDQAFDFTINQAFSTVIHHCKKMPRSGQMGTWITDEIEKAYTDLHQLGYAHSAETWLDGKLVGGLYGIRLGRVFFGESMFSLVSNASRFAFTKYVEQLKKEEVAMIDCQVYTEYLESMGARLIDRQLFVDKLNELIS
ncbi:MAG: leucyl/phenylalanyl-tRNA--protein transferase [Chitinophagaceae bacterium]|nr:leucyl/phenylalanyl-tRNA--protein transferase [Chitinophagaceae bacterium]